jgi:pimeloyl-ACP methyl ester carboxylesterase
MYSPATPREFQLMVLGQVLQTKPESSEGSMRAMADLSLWDGLILQQPTLAIRAGRQAPPGEEAFLRSLFPHLRYKFWEGVSHFLQLEKPEDTNREITEFLRSLVK